MWKKNAIIEKKLLKIRIAITLIAVFSATISIGAVAARISPMIPDDNNGIKLPVLMYHLVLSDARKTGEFVITADSFRRDMEYIKAEGYNTVVMEDIISYVKSAAPLPEKPIMITLDDGYYNNYLYAYPVLKELGMRAVMSIIGIEVERYTNNPDMNENYAHCTWDLLAEMRDSGVIEIQNHSYNLHHITNNCMGIGRRGGEEMVAYKTRLYTDLSKMQSLFKDKLGITPSTFAYPFGCAPKDGASVVRGLGFEATLGTEEKAYLVTRDEKCLERIPRYNRTNTLTAKAILEKAK